MNDRASFPEDEKPRYLLPDGCKDLIDALRVGKTGTKRPRLMHVSGGGPIELPEEESVAMGLSVLPRYVDQLFKNQKANVCLIISQAGGQCPMTVLRREVKIEFLYLSENSMVSDEARAIREFAKRHALPLSEDDGPVETRQIRFRLPASPQEVAAICGDVLATCLGVQPYDRLIFAVFAFD